MPRGGQGKLLCQGLHRLLVLVHDLERPEQPGISNPAELLLKLRSMLR